MPGRVDGETVVVAIGLLAGILKFSFEGFVEEGGEQGIRLGGGFGS
jgi:hypothetical protein